VLQLHDAQRDELQHAVCATNCCCCCCCCRSSLIMSFTLPHCQHTIALVLHYAQLASQTDHMCTN
jgi:hypothetical protein